MEIPAGDIGVAAACGATQRLLREDKIWHAEISVRTCLGASGVGIVADAVSWRSAEAERGWESFPDALAQCDLRGRTNCNKPGLHPCDPSSTGFIPQVVRQRCGTLPLHAYPLRDAPRP